MAPGPTCSKLSVRGLSRDSDADGGVRIVGVFVLARLILAVRAETPPSFVAVPALDVEAGPHQKKSTTEAPAAMGTKGLRRNTWTYAPWPLHGAIPVRAFWGAEAAQNAILVHLFVSNVPGAEKGPGAVVRGGEDVLHAVGFRASDAHANSLEGLRDEFLILGILNGINSRCFVEQVGVCP